MATPDQRALCAHRAERLAGLLNGDYPDILIANTWALLWEVMVIGYGADVLEQSQTRMDRLRDEVRGDN